MRITELLTRDTILLSLSGTGKMDAINGLVNKLDAAGKLHDRDAFKNAILKREEQSTKA